MRSASPTSHPTGCPGFSRRHTRPSPRDFWTYCSFRASARGRCALSLIAELVHGATPSFDDPARFSFAHGGKDGIPYPVDRPGYDRTIDLLERAIRRTKLGGSEERSDRLRLHRAFAAPIRAAFPQRTTAPDPSCGRSVEKGRPRIAPAGSVHIPQPAADSADLLHTFAALDPAFAKGL